VSSRFPHDRDAPVPSGRLSRLINLGGMAAGIAGRMAADGLSQMAQGKRPDFADLLLTPANALRFTERLSHMRGAAMKLGQMLSMDAGLVLPPELTSILSALREDAKPMPPAQLRRVLDTQWGAGWQARFARFDMRPFAAASIGQVHRAALPDGRELAVKVQYPGVRASIGSDIDNVAALLRLPGLLPRGMEIAPLMAEAKRQLREEADYLAEARHLEKFRQLLARSNTFIVPDILPELSTGQILAMTYIDSDPLESLAGAPQTLRDRVAADLIELTLRELFEFSFMQTDPNLANYRWQPATGKIVLLDFGAARAIAPALSQDFRALLNAGLDGGPEPVRAAMRKIGYFDAKVAARHRRLILQMFNAAMEPLRQEAPFDFGRADLLERLRDMGLAIGNDRDLTHVPPAETLFLHRKIGGMYLMAAKLRAKVELREIVERYR
jgi:predicted unusual protein kinase regulating ubiquinone biosynthesis (AarF/ABC1/UbiB family)